MICRKCGGSRFALRPNPKNPNATDLFCADCGAWVKFANADDKRLYGECDYRERGRWVQQVEQGGYIRTVCPFCKTKVATSYGGVDHNTFCDVCGAKLRP